MSIFERFGNIYNLLIDEEKRWAFERDFLVKLASASDAKEKGILDLACGTGFHTRHFAEAGFPVTGVDMSETMLAEAKRLAGDNKQITWINSDILNLSGLKRDFGLVLLIGNTFSAISEKEKVFGAVSSVLSSGGRFLLHVIDYDTLRKDNIRHLCRRGEVSGLDTVVTKVMTPIDTGMTVTMLVQQEGKDGWITEYDYDELTDVSDNEIIAAAEKQGLILENIFSDLTASPYRPGEGKDRVFSFTKK
ncbi:MAG: class I SAM-dependent methyltransferase [Planctomycetota bacterium]|jgi:ubiquinone/menaquinone biosynthesis C-methylase UbiE